MGSNILATSPHVASGSRYRQWTMIVASAQRRSAMHPCNWREGLPWGTSASPRSVSSSRSGVPQRADDAKVGDRQPLTQLLLEVRPGAEPH